MQTITRDIRLAVRLLLKSPGFTFVAILVLSLGIGANTAMFSIVNAMLFTPIAAQAPGIVGVYSRDTTHPDRYRAFSWQAYDLLRNDQQVFSEVLAQTMTMVGVTEGERTRRAFVAVVSANYFSTLGVRLAAGRAFSIDEVRPGSGQAVAIVGHQFARRAGIPPPDVIGQTVRINTRDYTIVGVAPEGFSGTMALLAPEFWLPMGMYERVADRMFTDGERADLSVATHRPLMLVGRLQPGVTIENASPKLEVLSGQAGQLDADTGAPHALVIARLPRTAISTRPQSESQTSTLAAVLMGMAALVLLIACLNLANMLLARGTARRKEIALRLALGSGRARVIAQLLTESLLIALAGGAAGLILAVWGTRLLTATFAAALPMMVAFEASADVRVLLAALGFSIASTILAGLAPAWRVTRPDVLPDLKEQPADAGAGRRFSLRNALVVGQVALSLALLTAAGLFVRGALKASAADPGFPLEGAVVGSLEPGLGGYDETRGRASFRAILQSVRSSPGVHAASVASLVPFGEFQEGGLVQKAGTPPAPPGQRDDGVDATTTIVGTDYFDAMRIPVLRGRGFDAGEESAAEGPAVAIVDETLARSLFGAEDPIGAQIQLRRTPERRYEIVGVVAGIRHSLFDRQPVPHLYLPFGQNYRGGMHLHVRSAGQGDSMTASLLADVRERVRSADAGVPLINLRTLEQHRDGSIGLWAVNTGARLFSMFGGVALLLAVSGVYGVKSYVVSRRTREIGIRMALGASTSQVLWMVLRESLALTAVGLTIGLLLAYGVAKAVSGMLYQVSAVDPLVFAAAPALLAAAAMAAAVLPARRASRVVPLTALRSE